MSIIALIMWGMKAIVIDFNALPALNALVIMKETELITCGTRVASREEASVMAPETSVTVKDAALSAQEANMIKKR
jgi:hypothetical protein